MEDICINGCPGSYLAWPETRFGFGAGKTKAEALMDFAESLRKKAKEIENAAVWEVENETEKPH